MALQPTCTSCNPCTQPATHATRHPSHAPQVRAAQPPPRSCCPPGSQSIFCDAHRATTLPAQYRFLPALRHVEASLTLIVYPNPHPHAYPNLIPNPNPSPNPNLNPALALALTDPKPNPIPNPHQTRQGLRRLRGAPLPLAGPSRRRLLRLPHALALARPSAPRRTRRTPPHPAAPLCTPPHPSAPPPHAPPHARRVSRRTLPVSAVLLLHTSATLPPHPLRTPSAPPPHPLRTPLCISSAGCSAGSTTPSRSTLVTSARQRRPGIWACLAPPQP
jgi:hypothetical protein